MILIHFLYAFLGGIVLNIMPCVFPVLSLKVLALLKDKSSNVISGLSYTVGVLISFFILSVTLIFLGSIGFMVGWGYNLQSPIFVILLTYLLFIIGLNLSGMFSLPMLSYKGSNSSSFLTGVLAVLVATPCTAPFMATALGFALTQPPLIALIIFQALGLGFAFPYFLFSIFPQLLCILPKPGTWMEKFKEFLAFPMYISAGWLFWVVISETNINLILTMVSGSVVIVFTIWLWKMVKFTQPAWRSFFVVFLLFLNFIPIKASYNLINYSYKEQNRIIYSQENLTKLLSQNQKVLVVVSADWCLMCKYNEQLVLFSDSVQNVFKKKGVIYMEADWTKHDEKITEYVKSFNRAGVPLYVLYDEKGTYKILPQILTQKIILEELEE